MVTGVLLDASMPMACDVLSSRQYTARVAMPD
nr:MAG TPA: hypothetical protein [Caudoviricetes sp.]